MPWAQGDDREQKGMKLVVYPVFRAEASAFV